MKIRFDKIAPGAVSASMEVKPEWTQQHGFVHAGVIATLADTVCGHAAYSLMDKEDEVLSVNMNVSLMRPAKGKRLHADGRVIKAGRRLHFTEALVFVDGSGEEEPVAKVTIVMAVVSPQDVSK